MIWPSWNEIWKRVDWNEVNDDVLMFRLRHRQFEELEGDNMEALEMGLMAEKLELARNHHKPRTSRLMMIAASMLMEIKMALMEEEAAERYVEGLEQERIETK